MAEAAGAGSLDDEPVVIGDVEESFVRNDDSAAYIAMVAVTGITANKDLLLPPSMRNQAPDGYWKTPEGRAELDAIIVPVSGNEFLLLESLSALVTRVSDSNTVDCLKENFGTVRDAFERSSPTVQCGNTIGQVKEKVTPCWICGLAIDSEYPEVELGPECEHVFPVAQALCFTGLYESQFFKQVQDKQGSTIGDAYLAGVRIEYDWAHRICNQVKNDTHFIEYDGSKFVISDAKIEAFFNELQTTQSYGTGRNFTNYIKAKTNRAARDWLGERVLIVAERCKQLIDAASSTGLSPLELAKVTVMSMRSFIVSTGKCVATKEVIPPLPGMTQEDIERAIATGQRSDLLLTDVPLTSRDPVAIARHSLKKGVENVTGLIDRFVDANGRRLGTAKQRGQILAFVATRSMEWSQSFQSQVETLARATLDKIAYKLITQNAITDETEYIRAHWVWSLIQTWTVQIIIGEVYRLVAKLLIPDLKANVHRAKFDEKDTATRLQAILNDKELVESVNQWAKQYVTDVKTKIGIPYDETLAVVVPAEWPRPAWYQAGGLRERRPLYSKPKHVGGSAPPPRRGLYAGLRERSGEGTPPSV